MTPIGEACNIVELKQETTGRIVITLSKETCELSDPPTLKKRRWVASRVIVQWHRRSSKEAKFVQSIRGGAVCEE